MAAIAAAERVHFGALRNHTAAIRGAARRADGGKDHDESPGREGMAARDDDLTAGHHHRRPHHPARGGVLAHENRIHDRR